MSKYTLHFSVLLPIVCELEKIMKLVVSLDAPTYEANISLVNNSPNPGEMVEKIFPKIRKIKNLLAQFEKESSW